MKLSHVLYAIGVVAALFVIRGMIDRQYHVGIADGIAEEQTRLDSIAAAYAEQARADSIHTARIRAERDSIAAQAQRDRERVQRRVNASRDSTAILRRQLSELDSVPDVVPALVEQYETTIQQQDTVIAIVSRELEAERALVASMVVQVDALRMQRSALQRAITARDEQIAALRDALDSGSLFPPGLPGQVLAGLAGVGIGMLVGG